MVLLLVLPESHYEHPFQVPPLINQKINLPGDDLFLFNCNDGEGPDSNIDIHRRNFLGLFVVVGEVFSKLLKSNFRVL